jgi:hypothetical protein
VAVTFDAATRPVARFPKESQFWFAKLSTQFAIVSIVEMELSWLNFSMNLVRQLRVCDQTLVFMHSITTNESGEPVRRDDLVAFKAGVVIYQASSGNHQFSPLVISK